MVYKVMIILMNKTRMMINMVYNVMIILMNKINYYKRGV